MKRPPKPKPQARNSREDPAVALLLRELEHPLKQEAEHLRQLILGASPEIQEGVKWNSPSFRTTEYFATINLHAKDRIRLILHTGAKAKDSAKKDSRIEDPAQLLEWLGKDRALVTLGGKEDLQSKSAALQALIREWLRHL
jgi:hypothetical protein